MHHPHRKPSGFAAGTLITAEAAEVKVQHLQPGMRLMTRDHGVQPVLAVLRFALPPEGEGLVHLARGTFGPGQPARDLRLGGQTRVLLQGAELDLNFGAREMFAEAGDLCEWAEPDASGPQHCYQVVMKNHEVILAEGVWAESLLLAGERALARTCLTGWEVQMVLRSGTRGFGRAA